MKEATGTFRGFSFCGRITNIEFSIFNFQSESIAILKIEN